MVKPARKPFEAAARLGARDWTRTSMAFQPPDPESGASTNFATRAPGGDYGASFGASISGVP